MNIYTRENAVFRSLRDRNMTITHADLDKEFNSIANYINKEIVPQIQALSSARIPGVQGMSGALLQNVGDGSTVWARINSKFDINDGTLSLSKLADLKPCGILSSGLDNTFKLVAPVASGYILSSVNNNIPKWQKATAANFDQRSIPALKVKTGTLMQAHLSIGILNSLSRPLSAGSVNGSHITDGTLDAGCFGGNIFDSTVISADLMAKRAANLTYLDKSITTKNIASNRIDFSSVAGSSLKLTSANIPLNSIRIHPANQIDTMLLSRGSIKPYHIAPNSFSGFVNNLFASGGGQTDVTCLFTKEHLTPALRAKLKL